MSALLSSRFASVVAVQTLGYIVFGCINALPVFYLRSNQVRAYYGMEKRAAVSVPQTNIPTISSERPKEITAIAIWLGASAIVALLQGSVIGWIMGGLLILFAWGVWQQKNWARIGAIILLGLNILLLIYALVASFALGGEGLGFLFFITVAGLVIQGGVLYWLATNGEYFE